MYRKTSTHINNYKITIIMDVLFKKINKLFTLIYELCEN